MKIFATYNIKGGVGKTASVINLAYLSARDGARTLVWDLDPQSAATFYFRIKPKIKGGHKGLIRRKRDIDDLIKATDYDNLDMLPADFSYRNMDLALDDEKKPTRQFRKLLKPLADEYDHIFLDCAPGISLVSENIFDAAHVLLIPMIPTTLSLRTFDQILKFHKNSFSGKLKVLSFFTLVDRRKKLHQEVIDTLPQKRAGILNTAIPYASDIEKMGIHRAPVASFAPRGKAAHAYEALWKEIKKNPCCLPQKSEGARE